jgi:FkbM family methyltransferase
VDIKKFLVHLYAGLVFDRQKRRAVRSVFFPQPIDPNEKFVFADDYLDMGGTDWATYMLTHDMPQVVASLRAGLDKKSNDLIDQCFSRMTIFPKYSWPNYKVRVTYLESLYSRDEIAERDAYRTELPQYVRDFKLDEKTRNADTFYFHTGLRNKGQKLKEYISGKDFIDAGAFIGDTALVYIKLYNPRMVWSLELSPKNCVRYKNVMGMNKISPDKYKIFAVGLSDEKQEITINDTAEQGLNVFTRGNDQVCLTDLDSFVLENDIKNIGFIKADIEGSGVLGLRGSTETIKRDRPVLNLSIYHSPQEFFELKPFLEEITKGLDYKITIEKHFPFVDRMFDVAVFAYPRELNDGK